MAEYNHFSRLVSVFHGKRLPESEVQLAGYAALIAAYNLSVPLPDVLSAISHKHLKYQENGWLMMTPRHVPEESLMGHLTYALKYECINLWVLKALFDAIDPIEITKIIQAEPTGSYSRRIWFLYEWLTKTILDFPDLKTGNFVDVVDSDLQYPGPNRLSKRHRVRNNLPGTLDFCPMIRKTPLLLEFQNMALNSKAQKICAFRKEFFAK